jgi:hypothetical protein
MIRKSEYSENIDRYFDSELNQPELNEFESQLEVDSDLADELNLHLEVEQAIGEHDLINLRKNLNQIINANSDIQEVNVFESFNFGLAEEFSSYQNMDHQVNADDFFNVGHSFPKIHLYQHKIAGKENIHQFYKEQSDSKAISNEESLTPFEEELFIDIQNALEENDILDIRTNLKQIAQSMPAHQYSIEDIENFVYNQMEPELREQFEAELTLNVSLSQDVRLISDIDIAAAEKDVMNLRASLKEIQKSELQSSDRIEEIEGFIYNELSDEEMASFEAELISNQELAKEIDLIRNINLAVKESDVMQLRSNIQSIASKIASEKQTEQSFVAKFKNKRVVIVSVAASLILLLSITGILSRQSSPADLYQKYYTTYQTTGINRSASLTTDQTLSEALQKFNNQDYDAALSLLQNVIAKDQNNMVGHFYTGVSLQETGKFQNAIHEYETVIIDKDNLFTEQAEWYIGLCYLQTSENKKAYKQFKKIAKNEGFYQLKAQAILNKMKYSD